MHLNHDELLLLSRGGRVPRASAAEARSHPPQCDRPGRLGTLVAGLRRRSHRRAEVDVHTYLELEFVVDDELR